MGAACPPWPAGSHCTPSTPRPRAGLPQTHSSPRGHVVKELPLAQQMRSLKLVSGVLRRGWGGASASTQFRGLKMQKVYIYNVCPPPGQQLPRSSPTRHYWPINHPYQGSPRPPGTSSGASRWPEVRVHCQRGRGASRLWPLPRACLSAPGTAATKVTPKRPLQIRVAVVKSEASREGRVGSRKVRPEARPVAGPEPRGCGLHLLGKGAGGGGALRLSGRGPLHLSTLQPLIQQNQGCKLLRST